MSVFGRATFSAAGYAAARPTYPPSLFNTLLKYHRNSPNSSRDDHYTSLVDLGCGHGLVARELSPHFTATLGLDPSAGMVKQASSTPTPKTPSDKTISFRQGVAEDLSFLPDASLDMVVAGQAAHWYDYSKVWPELRRVVKPGGSLGFFGYKDHMLINHPRANALTLRYLYEKNFKVSIPGHGQLENMAQYWEQPGRNILRDLLVEVEPPSQDWDDITRELYDVKEDIESLPDHDTAWMRKEGMKLGELEKYFRTFSSYQGWKDANPEVKSREEGGEGDVVDVLMEDIVGSEEEWKGAGERWRDEEADLVWGTYILLARRR